MITVLNKSVPQWILSNSPRTLWIPLLSQQEINHFLQQNLWCHLPDNPVEQRCGSQNAHLWTVHNTNTPTWASRAKAPKRRIAWRLWTENKKESGAYVCISCGSITDTKNLSLTAFAITVAADCDREKKSVHFSLIDTCQLKKKMKRAVRQQWWKCQKDLMSLLDELITVIQPGQKGDESPLPRENSSILFQVIYIQAGKRAKHAKFNWIFIIET